MVSSTYLQALVSVAQAQLPAGHRGLLGAPALSTDHTPALRPVRVCAQHLDAALVAGTATGDADLRGTKVLGTTERRCVWTKADENPIIETYDEISSHRLYRRRIIWSNEQAVVARTRQQLGKSGCELVANQTTPGDRNTPS